MIELEDHYKDMKKKYSHLDIWDDLLKIIDKHKKKLLSRYKKSDK